ncbi:MAG: type II toxin-antitoxin system VapB family antitoxin [Cyanobacteria bacterium P01_F01_bin.4]
MPPQLAKIFMNGSSQAVRLPKEFRFPGSTVYIRRQGDEVILSPNPPSWDNFFETPSAFGDDFLSERDNTLPQTRK